MKNTTINPTGKFAELINFYKESKEKLAVIDKKTSDAQKDCERCEEHIQWVTGKTQEQEEGERVLELMKVIAEKKAGLQAKISTLKEFQRRRDLELNNVQATKKRLVPELKREIDIRRINITRETIIPLLADIVKKDEEYIEGVNNLYELVGLNAPGRIDPLDIRANRDFAKRFDIPVNPLSLKQSQVDELHKNKLRTLHEAREQNLGIED